MPIDLMREKPLSLTEATKAAPTLDGKRLHPSTVWRWIRDGIRGVHLEHCEVGRRVATSREALTRFFNALAQDDRKSRSRTGRRRPKHRRERANQRAKAVLHKAGIIKTR